MKTKEKIKQGKAITLIALVITIIILLILATITIVELRNTKLFNKTIEARDKYKQAESNETNMLDDYANKINEIAGGNVTKKIDRTPPEVTLTQDSVTANSITVTATAVDKESGMPEEPIYTFYIKETSVDTYPSEPSQKGKQATFTATGLTSDTEYNILVKSSDKKGNEGKKEIQIKTESKQYIYKNGKFDSDIYKIGNTSFTQYDSYFNLSAWGAGSTWNGYQITTTKQYNVSQYNALCIHLISVKSVDVSGRNIEADLDFGLADKSITHTYDGKTEDQTWVCWWYEGSDRKAIKCMVNGNDIILKIDISQLQGNYQISVGTRASDHSSSNISANIDEIYLEK